MGSIAFLLTTGPYSNQHTDTLIGLVHAAREEGHDVVGVYFYVDGVYNANKQVKPGDPKDRDISQQIEDIVKMGIPVGVCPVCAVYRGLTPENLIPGTKMEGLGFFAELAEDADRVVVLG